VPGPNRKWLVALALLVLGGVRLFVFLDQPPALPAVIIWPPAPLGKNSGRVPDRWIPAEWVWLHKACEFLLGSPKKVGYHVQFINTSGTVASIISQNAIGQPKSESKELAAWILPDRIMHGVKGASTVLSAPRLIAIEGGQARIMTAVGNADGYSADLFSWLGREKVDLRTSFGVITAGKATFVAGARAQIPYGQALLLLDTRRPESATNRVEILITTDEIDAKGNALHSTARAAKK
jgi:hypothetical protein